MEIEAKINLTPTDATRILHILLESPNWNRLYEVNILYDRFGELRHTDQILRVRRESNFFRDMHVTIFTHKGPSLEGKYKTREETNVVLGAENGAAIEKMFKVMGYEETFRYEKIRVEVPRFSSHICLDEIPYLGFFLEVEGETEEDISRILEELNLSDRVTIKTGYPDLLRSSIKAIPYDMLPNDRNVFAFPPDRIEKEREWAVKRFEMRD